MGRILPLQPEPVNTFFLANDMRKVRNECREYMTNDQNYIGFITQWIWYYGWYMDKFKKGEFKAWVYYKRDDDGRIIKDPVGYGILRDGQLGKWVTGGVVEKERGNGYGDLIFRHLINENKVKDTYLAVLVSNTRARNLYEKLRFKTVGIEGKSKDQIIMRRFKDE